MSTTLEDVFKIAFLSVLVELIWQFELSNVVGKKLRKCVSGIATLNGRIWSWFGDGRVLFGSDWPNSDHQASYRDTLAMITEYLASKSQMAQQKYF